MKEKAMKNLTVSMLIRSVSALSLMAAAPALAADPAGGQVMIRNAGDDGRAPPPPASEEMPAAAMEAAVPEAAPASEPAPAATETVVAAPAPAPAPPAPVLTDPVMSLATAPVPAMAAETAQKPVTLNEAVAVGVITNPEYKVVASNRRATDEELRQAKALYLPSIDFRADTGAEHSEDPATRARGRGTPQNLWRYENSLTLTQLLFDGWETKYENQRQKHRVESASRRVRETSELTGLAVVEAYLEVLRQRELLRISRENVADHVSLMGQINESSAAGRTTQADVEQAKARLAAARAQESSIRESLRNAEASYISAVGDQPGALVMPGTPAAGLAQDVEQEVKTSLAQSPTLDVFEADIKVAHAEYEGAKAVFYPQIDLQLNGRDGRDLGGVRGTDTSASALMVMNWNLYRGGGDTARVRENINRESQAKEQRASAARDVEKDVRQTWARMVSAGERARQFSAQAAANAEVVKAYRDQFNLDRRTLLDVLDSQNEYFVSRSSAINAEFLEMFAVFRLLALKGDLLKTLGVDYPREADPAKM